MHRRCDWLPILRRSRLSCRFCRWVERRWPTGCSPPSSWTSPSRRYPLDLVFCPHCALVQITETVPPEELFRDYVYFSSFSDTMLRHARAAGRRVDRRAQAAAHEPGHRDRQQRRLPACRTTSAAGMPVLGIEPAANIAAGRPRASGASHAVRVLRPRAGRAAGRSCGQRADVIHAHNVLAHVPDLNGFVAGPAHACSRTTAWRSSKCRTSGT